MATDPAIVVAASGAVAGFALAVAGRVRRRPLVVIIGLLTALWPPLFQRSLPVAVIAGCDVVLLVGGLFALLRPRPRPPSGPGNGDARSDELHRP